MNISISIKNLAKNHLGNLACSILFLAISGCTFNSGIRNQTDFLQSASVEEAPIVAPIRSVSVLRDGLACMDRTLRDQGVPSTLIAIKNIPDVSGLFSTSTKDMLITAISRMSRTSKAFRVVDYEIDPLRQDTVQNMTGLLLSNGLMHLQKPQIYISGSISFADKSIVSKRRNIGLSTETVDSSAGYDVLGSIVGLELHLGDMDSRTLLSGMDSANEVVVAGGGRSISLGGKVSGLPKKIYQLGIQADISNDVSEGAGAAIRSLVDLEAIELVGKWAHVPYWECIAYDQNDPEFLRQVREWYDAMNLNSRRATIQKALISTGYLRESSATIPAYQLKHSLMRYQVDNDLIPSGTIDFETYQHILRRYIVQDKQGKFLRIGWGKDVAAMDSIAQSQEKPPVKLGTAMQFSSALLIQTVGKQNNFTVGDPLVFRISPTRSGKLYCYYQDASNAVTQIFPNPQQTSAQTVGNQSTIVPNIYNSNSFLIEETKAGKEALFCAQLVDAPNISIPEQFNQADLQAIPSLNNLNSIKAFFHSIDTSQQIYTGELNWNVDQSTPKIK